MANTEPTGTVLNALPSTMADASSADEQAASEEPWDVIFHGIAAR